MKKLLTIVTESGEKARIDEGVNVSINVSGDSPCDVGEVLAKVTNLSGPRPVTPDMMPAISAPPPMPMVKAIDIVGKADEPTGPAVPPAPPGDMEPHSAPEAEGGDVMMPDPSDEDIGTGGIMSPPAGQSGGAPMGGAAMGGAPDELEELISQAEEELGVNAPEEEEESLLDPAMGSAHGSSAAGESKALKANSSYKEIHDRLREIDRALQKKNEEFKNQPDPKMSDVNYMTKDLAGGLNKPKTMHKHSYKQGDNPMAMETIVREEWQKFKGGE